MTALRSPGHVPAGYRWFISPAYPRFLHLSQDGVRTLCGKLIRDAWYEPRVTQRTKCRPCWLARSERERGA